ncbi:NAD(FAD)-utilizing dehydrogenase [Pseudooceanicola nanhaiensis]|uniref:NAD(FAD)-utilizing dehydrogenase n=1 Tax=Pseudooceanicola nanhaiensis TaxID=375761 RepID=A0A917SW79_9RHOB|nr:TIGR03862 family flavoprotein [Pseudooceanicola nanhaiensis]GGL98633.1 NAD(FAD)-utilizing dehydrogenase [Pseudooceanicola nanhaiensis]
MSETETLRALVIGGGPAGLMAAGTLAEAGFAPVVAERMPSVGRKLLMAGKSGLNLTKEEPAPAFRAAYGGAAAELATALDGFGPAAVMSWAEGLGQPLFTGSTGRVFPEAMKASPLLRAWLARLREGGTELRTRWRWTGWDGPVALFETPDGTRRVAAEAIVLALGGASWARLGSDGRWSAAFPADRLAPFRPSNAGIRVEWSAHMQPHFGTPLKGVAFHAGDRVSRGEAVISATGLEGGGVYPLTPALREGAPLTIDLFPDLGTETLRQRLARRRRGDSLANHLRRAVNLSSMARALVMECGRPLPEDLAPLLKALPVPVAGLAPLDRAISTAGGLRFDALEPDLMLRDRPGVFAAGEMLDWEAPTGGYLLTACLATGRQAGLAAARHLEGRPG